MKRFIAALAVVGFSATALARPLYVDPIGDVFTTAGGGILDITSVEVTNTLSDITFKFNLAGDVVATDWGKYMIAIDGASGGDPAGNGWARPISMPSGMDRWLGSWVDSGNGVQTFAFSGTWNMTAANGPFAGPGGTAAASPDVSITKSGNMVVITASLASLGVNPGDTILFDAFTSGGGGTDGAVDSLGNPTQQISDWGQPSNAAPVSYLLIPGPGALALLGVGGLVVARRRR